MTESKSYRDKMRQGQQNKRARRGGRKMPSPHSRVYESNGPDVKVRGTAAHVAEKYLNLARDAQASGDPVAAENYLQHAEHYLRIIAASQPQPQYSAADSGDGDDEEQAAIAVPISPPGRGEQREAREGGAPEGRAGSGDGGAEEGSRQGARARRRRGNGQPSRSERSAHAGNGADQDNRLHAANGGDGDGDQGGRDPAAPALTAESDDSSEHVN